MSFVEDLSVFFADFGVPATPESGDPFTVIFDKAHIEALGGEISTTQPVSLAQDVDVVALVCRTSLLTINGVQYRLQDKHPDGTGLTLLQLEYA